MFNPFVNKKKDEFEQQKEIVKIQGVDNLIASEVAPEREDIAARAYVQEQKDNLTKWQQNLEPELQQIMHDLKKEIMVGVDDEGKEIWEPIGGKPICTNEFVHRFLTKARPFMTKNLMMSNYSEERILQIIRFALIDLYMDIGYNRTKYKVDKGDMDHIIQVFKSYITPTLFRPMQQGERKHISTTSKESLIRTIAETEQKPKKMGFF